MTILRRTSLAALSVAALLVASGCGSDDKTSSSKPSGSSQAATYELSDFKIAGPSSLKAGNVKVTTDNSGKIPHELIFIKTAKKAADLGSGQRVSEKGSVGEIPEFPGGANKSKSFDLKPGHYALICNVPGHYKDGMYQDLTVK